MKKPKAQTQEGKLLSDLIEKIKRSTGFTQEDIANKIGYKREYLSQAKMEGSEKLLQLLQNVFRSELENLTSSEVPQPTQKTQSSDMPTDPERLEIAIMNLSETDRINAKNIERLISLLEVKILGKSTLSLASPNDEVKDVMGTMSSEKEKAK